MSAMRLSSSLSWFSSSWTAAVALRSSASLVRDLDGQVAHALQGRGRLGQRALRDLDEADAVPGVADGLGEPAGL
ncbi:hypothetical protein O2W18_06920 [Modestobacter sp. VKM Ac-2983]|nr:hypothetical protein [Modestobacter sp. VKM Ac-2983]